MSTNLVLVLVLCHVDADEPVLGATFRLTTKTRGILLLSFRVSTPQRNRANEMEGESKSTKPSQKACDGHLATKCC